MVARKTGREWEVIPIWSLIARSLVEGGGGMVLSIWMPSANIESL